MAAIRHVHRHSEIKNPAYLSSDRKLLYERSKKNDRRVTNSKVKEYLQSDDVYTLNRQVKRNFNRNSYRVFFINDLWQYDLADLSLYSDENDNYRYILISVDVFSKYAHARPLKDKSGKTVTRAFKDILVKSDRGIPKVVSSDKGKEFKNSYMSALLSQHGIKQQFLYTTSLFKASCVEILIKTLKMRMQKYFVANNTRRWIDVLDDIVTAYNNTKHSTTKMAPAQIEPRHVPYVYHNTHAKHANKKGENSQHLQVGDYVRVVTKKNLFQQTFTEKWTREIFRVIRIINTPIRMYKLEDLDHTELTGKFYNDELQRILLHPQAVLKTLKNDIFNKKNTFY